MKKKATTLIEIIIYFTLFAIFMAGALSFAFQIIQISELSSRSYELETQAAFMQEKIKTTIQSAESVDEVGSIFDSDEGALSLFMPAGETSPILFYVSEGELLMQEGAALTTPLHASSIAIESLNFHRIEYTKTPDQIQVEALLIVPSDFATTDVSTRLQFTVSLRQ